MISAHELFTKKYIKEELYSLDIGDVLGVSQRDTAGEGEGRVCCFPDTDYRRTEYNQQQPTWH